MKRFKLLSALLIASALTVSGCNLLMPSKGSGKKKKSSSTDITDTSGTSDTSITSGDSGSSGSSDTSGSSGTSTTTTPPGPSYLTAWPAEVVTELNTYVGEQLPVAPFLASTFYHEYNSSYSCYVLGDDNESDIMTAYMPTLTSSGYELSQDASGNECYVKYRASDNMIVTVYGKWYQATTDYDAGNEMQIYVAEKQERTTDTEWRQEVKDAMIASVGEVIPFIALGENYTIYGAQNLFINIYDEYTEDLSQEYKPILVAAGYTFNGTNDNDEDVYSKTKQDGSVLQINVYFDDYGNEIDVSLTPNTTTVTSWNDIEPLSGFITYAEKTIPAFEITAGQSYSYYTFGDLLHIEGPTTENLSTTYATALENAGYFVSDGQGDDWYEKIRIVFNPQGTIDEDTGEYTSVTGFEIDVTKLTPTSDFSETWPDTAVANYLDEYQLDTDIPELTNTTSYKFRIFRLTYEELFEEEYANQEFYSALIVAFGGEALTEEEMTEAADQYASANAGLYISIPDDSSTLVAIYRALFGEGWTETSQTSDEVTYYYEEFAEDGVTLCVYNLSGIFYVQILEPTPVPVGEVITVEFLTAESDSSSSYTDDNALEAIKTGAEYFSSASNVAKVYKGKSGLKFGSSSVNGTLTLNFAEPVQASTIDINTVQYGSVTNGQLNVYVNGDSSNSVTLTATDSKSLTVNDTVSSITFESTKRIYLASFVVNP